MYCCNVVDSFFSISAQLFGDEFAKDIVSSSIGQVIIVVRNDIYDEISEKVEEYGIITIAKPMNRTIFWSVLKIANATYNKIYKLKKENNKLLQKIEDIKKISGIKDAAFNKIKELICV